jgi:hypothetical protein
MTVHDIKLKKPHGPIQRSMIEYDGNVVAFCGRRFGKTDAYVSRIYRKMIKKPGLYWWVGLSWRSASMKRAWREVTGIARGIYQAAGLKERDYVNRSSYEVRIPGLGEIWFRTAENPSSLAGEGIYGAVVDEFSLMAPEVWTEYLQGTLLDYNGWAAFGGVPKGINWASALWDAAAYTPGWLQVHASTFDNPYIDKASIEEVKATTSQDMFRQEYLAEVVADGAVFRKIKEAAVAKKQEYPQHGYQSNPKHRYVMGVDLAQLHDFTAIVVIDATTREQCFLERFNKISWDYQLKRIKAIADLFNPSVINMDQTGVGSPIVEQAQRDFKQRVVGVTFKQRNKEQMIEALRLAFDSGTIKITDDTVLISELQGLQATRSGDGIKFEASSGYHDDTVMALALAWDAAKDSQPVVVQSYQPVRGKR